MDAKLFSGTTKCQKDIVSENKTCLYYIKVHGVHGNPTGTVAGSEACPLHLQADPRSTLACRTIFRGFLPYSTNSRKANCQLMAKQNGP